MAVAGTAGTWAGRGAVSVQLSPANWEPSLLDQREKGPKSPSPGTLGRSSRERYPPMLPTGRGLYLSRPSTFSRLRAFLSLPNSPAHPPILPDPPRGP